MKEEKLSDGKHLFTKKITKKGLEFTHSKKCICLREKERVIAE